MDFVPNVRLNSMVDTKSEIYYFSSEGKFMELTTFKLPTNEISLLCDLFEEHDSR